MTWQYALIAVVGAILVSWGFDLSVPEPGTVLLMVLALGLLVGMRRKAAAR